MWHLYFECVVLGVALRYIRLRFRVYRTISPTRPKAKYDRQNGHSNKRVILKVCGETNCKRR